MYHRVVRLRGHDAESVMQAAIRNKWFAFLDTRFGVRLSYLAAECGGTRLFKRICERFRGLPVTPQHAITAAFNGSLDIVKFIFRVARKNPSAMASIAVPQVMDAAACNGHLAIVEFLHNEIRLKCTAAAMQKAATSGHLAVLQFLYNNKAEESPSHAMDAAARNGHLKIVAYLLEKNAKICMPRAVDGAVEGGHAAMDAAARVGSLAMLTWLHDNVGIGCTTAALIDAAAGGHDDVVRWLLRHMRDTDWDLVAAIRAAEKRGDAGMSRLLREYGQANFLDVA
nr:hypothetical protein HK105_004144 [Polyrhizophydium stewartii]